MKAKKTVINTNQDWPQRISAWEQSDLSGAGFCKQHDLVYHQFVYWKRKLAKSGGLVASKPPAAFIKVAPLPEPEQDITLTLPGGLEISGLNVTNIGLIGQILAQL